MPQHNAAIMQCLFLLQISKTTYMQRYVSDVRETFRDLSKSLVQPCSLFDSNDTDVIKVMLGQGAGTGCHLTICMQSWYCCW